VSAKIEDDDRIGLIGPNGAGKSTLLRLICREELPDDGTVAVSNRKTIGVLHQNSGLERAGTILEEMQSVFGGLLTIKRRIEEIEAVFSAGTVTPADPEY